MNVFYGDVCAIALFGLAHLSVFMIYVLEPDPNCLELTACLLLLMFCGGVMCHVWVKCFHWEISRSNEKESPLFMINKC